MPHSGWVVKENVIKKIFTNLGKAKSVQYNALKLVAAESLY